MNTRNGKIWPAPKYVPETDFFLNISKFQLKSHFSYLYRNLAAVESLNQQRPVGAHDESNQTFIIGMNKLIIYIDLASPAQTSMKHNHSSDSLQIIRNEVPQCKPILYFIFTYKFFLTLGTVN